MIKTQKKDYLTLIHKLIYKMSDDKLITLYNLHSDLFVKTNQLYIPHTHRYKTFKDLTFNKIKKYTPQSQYLNILNIIHLVHSNYNYDQIYNILLNLI